MRNRILTIITAAVFVLGGGAAALASAGTGTVRPHTARSTSITPALTPLVQEFSTTTVPFCPAGSGNAPCDGAEGDYGTITRVASGTGGVPALAKGEGFYAATAGTQATASGCPATPAQEAATGDEYCTGPYALFDGGQLTTFPATGFTVTADLYLTPAEPGIVSADIGLNNSDGAYGSDNTINFCPVTGGLAVSPGGLSCSGTTPQITKAGWYRVTWDFTPDAGTVALNENVTSEATGYAAWQGALDAPVTVNGVAATLTNSGGPSYFWLPVENINSLPLSNFAVRLGNFPGGSAPDQVTATSPVTRLAVSPGKWLRFSAHAASADGLGITGWELKSGKPSGLSISKYGLIRGRAVRQRQTVTVIATDASGVTGTVSFRLVVR